MQAVNVLNMRRNSYCGHAWPRAQRPGASCIPREESRSKRCIRRSRSWLTDILPSVGAGRCAQLRRRMRASQRVIDPLDRVWTTTGRVDARPGVPVTATRRSGSKALAAGPAGQRAGLTLVEIGPRRARKKQSRASQARGAAPRFHRREARHDEDGPALRVLSLWRSPCRQTWPTATGRRP